MSELGKDYTHQHYHQDQQPPPQQYGTFQGVHNYPPPPPVIGFPQPAPPPSVSGGPFVNHYVHGYHAVQGYAVAEGRPVRLRRLPCCGLGLGWLLFVFGFFLPLIPWYVGSLVLTCTRYDHREKPGYIACLIAGVIGTIVMIFGVTSYDWDLDLDW